MTCSSASPDTGSKWDRANRHRILRTRTNAGTKTGEGEADGHHNDSRAATLLRLAGLGRTALLGRRRHADDDQAQSHRLYVCARRDLLLQRAADHVRPVVPVRIRGCDPYARVPLRAVPHAGHLRPDSRLRVDRHLYRSCRGLAEGPHRALPSAPHVALGQYSPAGRQPTCAAICS